MTRLRDVYAAFRQHKGVSRLLGVGDTPEAARAVCQRNADDNRAGPIPWGMVAFQDQGTLGAVTWYTSRMTLWGEDE